MSDTEMGISGKIAKKFLLTEITPLLALVGVAVGSVCGVSYTS